MDNAKEKNSPSPINSSLLASQDALTHGFFTRKGGSSEGFFASLNLARTKGDTLAHVNANRDRIASRFEIPSSHLLIPDQVHKDRVLFLEKPFPLSERPSCDALVTRTPGLALGIITADCVPLLLYDPKKKIIAAVHSGWKGASLNIALKTLQLMILQGTDPSDVLAAIGPCIHQKSYEVGPEVQKTFLEKSPESRGFFQPSPTKDHFLFDLPGLVMSQLKEAGVRNVELLPFNTYEEEDLFYSCRRAFHRKEPTFGCFLSAIMLK